MDQLFIPATLSLFFEMIQDGNMLLVDSLLRVRTDIKTVFQNFPGLAKTKFQRFPGLKKLVFKDFPGYTPFTNMVA